MILVDSVTAATASSISTNGNSSLPLLNRNDAAAFVATADRLSVIVPTPTAEIVVLLAMPSPLTIIPTLSPVTSTFVTFGKFLVMLALRLAAALSTNTVSAKDAVLNQNLNAPPALPSRSPSKSVSVGVGPDSVVAAELRGWKSSSSR